MIDARESSWTYRLYRTTSKPLGVRHKIKCNLGAAWRFSSSLPSRFYRFQFPVPSDRIHQLRNLPRGWLPSAFVATFRIYTRNMFDEPERNWLEKEIILEFLVDIQVVLKSSAGKYGDIGTYTLSTPSSLLIQHYNVNESTTTLANPENHLISRHHSTIDCFRLAAGAFHQAARDFLRRKRHSHWPNHECTPLWLVEWLLTLPTADKNHNALVFGSRERPIFVLCVSMEWNLIDV